MEKRIRNSRRWPRAAVFDDAFLSAIQQPSTVQSIKYACFPMTLVNNSSKSCNWKLRRAHVQCIADHCIRRSLLNRVHSSSSVGFKTHTHKHLDVLPLEATLWAVKELVPERPATPKTARYLKSETVTDTFERFWPKNSAIVVIIIIQKNHHTAWREGMFGVEERMESVEQSAHGSVFDWWIWGFLQFSPSFASPLTLCSLEESWGEKICTPNNIDMNVYVCQDEMCNDRGFFVRVFGARAYCFHHLSRHMNGLGRDVG